MAREEPMRRSRLYFGLLVLIIVVIITCTSLGMLNVAREEESYQVSVIVTNSGSDQWISFKEGLEQGAEDNNINLNIVSTSKFTNIEEQYDVINREIKNGARGIVLEFSFSDIKVQTLDSILLGAALVLVETGITPENVYTAIIPDNYAIGKTTATTIIKDWNNDLNGVKIGILSGNQNKLAMQQRLSGFEESIHLTKAQVLWNIEGSGDNVMQNLKDKQNKQPVDVLVALDNYEIETTMDYMNMEKSCKFKVYGEGSSEKAVYYLDKGYIQSLSVPNQFNMGYQSMLAVADKIKNNVTTVEDKIIDFLVVNKNNLYDKSNLQLLFPIVQ